MLSAGRAAIGAGAWLAPGPAARLLGLDAGAEPRLALLVRLFAIRDLALAAGLRLSHGQSRRLWLGLGIVADAADAAAGVLASRGGDTTLRVTAPALAGVGMGVAALREL